MTLPNIQIRRNVTSRVSEGDSATFFIRGMRNYCVHRQGFGGMFQFVAHKPNNVKINFNKM